MKAIHRPAVPEAREFALDRRRVEFALRTTDEGFRASIAGTELAGVAPRDGGVRTTVVRLHCL